MADLGVYPQVDPTVDQQEGVGEQPGLSEWFGFKVVGDNVDKTVKPRHMRSDRQSQSLHYFHLYAVHDRINLMESCESPRPVPQNPPLEELLPSPDDHTQLHHNMVTLVTRTLAKHIPFIAENIGDVVVRHTLTPKKCLRNLMW